MITTTYQFVLAPTEFRALVETLESRYGAGHSQTQLDATVLSHPEYTLSYARDAQEGVLAVLMINSAWVLPETFKHAVRG